MTGGREHAAIGAARLTVALVGEPAVERAWLDTSVLPGYRVGGLAVHLVRAIETIRQYAMAESPPPATALVDAAGYFAGALGQHDPLTSEFHASVRARGENRVEAGHGALVAAAAEAMEWLDSSVLDLDQPVSVMDGIAIRLGAYLDTRLVELVIHSDDLAASLGVDPPAFADDAWQVVADVLVATARERLPRRSLALALARPERYGPIGAFGAIQPA